MSPQQQFGEALRAAWERSELTQRELAARMSKALNDRGLEGVDQRHVGNWINGRNLPKERYKYLALCQVLYTSVPQGLRSLQEIHDLLAAGDRRALQYKELKEWLPELADEGNDDDHETTIPHHREEVPSDLKEREDVEPEVEPGEVAANDSNLGEHPRNAPYSGTAERPERQPWYTHFMVGLGTFLKRLEPSEQYGMIGAVTLATFCLWLTWYSPAQWGGRPIDAILLVASLWLSSLILVVPPTVSEPFDRNGLWWRRKLYRFSGAVWGIFLAVALLVWIDGLWQLVGGARLPQALVFLVLLFGAVFAYAAGANIQWWVVRGRESVKFYTDTARFFSLMGLFAQAYIVLVFYYLLRPIWTLALILIFVVPAALTIAESLKRKPPE